MPLLKINGMTLKSLPDIAIPKMPLSNALRSLLPAADAEYQERWQHEFFGYNWHEQMLNGKVEIDMTNKVIIGNPRTIMKWVNRELRDGLSYLYREPHAVHDLWLGKRQFPYFDEIWGYSNEVQNPKTKCSCGRCHITFPNAQIKRAKRAQKPEIQAYELAA